MNCKGRGIFWGGGQSSVRRVHCRQVLNRPAIPSGIFPQGTLGRLNTNQRVSFTRCFEAKLLKI